MVHRSVPEVVEHVLAQVAILEVVLATGCVDVVVRIVPFPKAMLKPLWLQHEFEHNGCFKLTDLEHPILTVDAPCCIPTDVQVYLLLVVYAAFASRK